jgi:ABC-type transport system involved in multi-copper enzyme maturation permease subunit
MAITIKQRALAGFWFMASAALLIIPIFIFTVEPSPFPDNVVWFLLAPLLISGLVGSVLGASILDAQRVRSGWRAALRGLLIAAIAYLLYAIVLSAWTGYTNHGGLSFGEAFGRTIVLLLVGGVIVFGWMAALVGAFAGWALHLISASLERGSGVR